MICRDCQFENPAGMQFCGKCGAELAPRCPECGTENPAGFQFCGQCGVTLTSSSAQDSAVRPSLEEQFGQFQEGLPDALREQLLTPMEGENRVVTVLFADMTASVETTGGLHPEDAAALVNRLLKSMVDVLVKYEGRILRLLGDGVLAVFGTPQAHENDPERAIRAAMEIREAAQELNLHVTAGINTGEVYLGEIGSEGYQEVTVMGPVVNLAARLQGKAEPGEIVVGEASYRHTKRAFEFEPRQLEVKGVSGPVTAYRVERVAARPEKVRGIEGLRAERVGRDEEFEQLQDALAEVRRGRGQIVTLIGEAGVGKSRLVADLKDEALNDESNDATPLWLEGRCLELGMTASYWPFIDMLRDHLGMRPEDDDTVRAERLKSSVEELVDNGHLSEERYEEVGPVLGHLLSIRFGDDWDDRLKFADAKQVKHQTFTAIRDVFLALAQRQPLVLVFEDLHWSDGHSVDLISLLMDALTMAPLLLVCVYRPEQEHKCWHLGTIAGRKCPERFSELRLHELKPQESRRLVESLLRIEDLPESVREMILERSGGNPFFVEEVVRSLIDAGLVYRDGESWKASEEIESVHVPESIQSVVLSRMDRLEDELKGVLQSASVIGRLFRRRLLERINQEETELERALWELEDHAFIYQERAVPEEEYSFQHAITQETVYHNLLKRRRVVFHRQVAETMERLYADSLDEYYEQLAHHYRQAGVAEKVAEYALKAGQKAQEAYLNDEALGYFREVLELLDESDMSEAHPDWRLESLKGLGQVQRLVGQTNEAVHAFQKAISLAEQLGRDPRERVWLFDDLAQVLQRKGHFEKAIALCEDGIDLLDDEAETEEFALMIRRLTFCHNNQGDNETARALIEWIAPLIGRLPYSKETRKFYTMMIEASTLFKRDADEARRWLEALEQGVQQNQDLQGLAAVHDYRAYLASMTGDLRGAIPDYERAVQIAERSGDMQHVIAMEGGSPLASLGINHFVLGELDEAAGHFRRAKSMAEHNNSVNSLVFLELFIGSIAFSQGQIETALESLERASRLADELKRDGGTTARLSLGQVYRANGEMSRAHEQFEKSLRLACQMREGAAPGLVAIALAAMEELTSDSDDFRSYCEGIQREYPDAGAPTLAQWFLEPKQPRAFPDVYFTDRFEGSIFPKWTWQDPYDDCSYRTRKGLEIRAANGRIFWHTNVSAPRVLAPAPSGDFAIQTECVPATIEKPAIGGLLIWKDEQAFVSLSIGDMGSSQVNFSIHDNQKFPSGFFPIVGRGFLPSEPVYLRLERVDETVTALCSADGSEWYTVGQTEFRNSRALQVGLYAWGLDQFMRCSWYPGAHADGTAIRFKSFEIWTPSDE